MHSNDVTKAFLKMLVLFEKMNSERSDECIDFTMLCVFFIFFVCLCTRERVEIMLRFSTSVAFPVRNTEKNQNKKLRKTGNFYVKPVFDLIDFFIRLQLKTNHYKYLKFSPNVYFLISYSYSDKKIIRIHRDNFFLLAFEVQILTKIRQNYEYFQIILPFKHKPPFSLTIRDDILG
ncbi:hypothetical protein AGLY_002938 [Aphis glycines]|uniref:Uncharacterized protein n=1 Tax=Aphis glycines TaxID=307491 RepID=A0A6G0U240_APHGL|nr:hypothetical protein AGLY_002938 [Aphis glycines]